MTTEAPQSRHQDAIDLARGTGVNLLGNLGKISRPVTFMFAGRVFGAEALGLFLLAWSVVDFLSKLAVFGLDVSIVKYVTRHRLKEAPDEVYAALGQAFTLGLTASLCVTMGLALLAPWIAEALFDKPHLTWPLVVLSLCIPFLAASYILLGATKALRIMRFDIYCRNIVEPFTFLLAVLLSSLVWQDGRGLSLAQSLAFLASAAAAFAFFTRHFPVGRCLRSMSLGSFRSPLAGMAFPVSIYNVLNVFASRLDLFILGYFMPVGRVGVYGIAKEVAVLIKKFRQACEPMFLPVVSEQIQAQERDRLHDTLATAARWTLAVSLPFLGILAVSGHTVLALFGSAFVAGTAAALLLALANLVNSVFGFSEFVLLMSGRPYLNLINTVIVVAITGLVGVLLIPSHEILALPLAALLAFCVVNAVRLIQVKLLAGVHPFRWGMAKPIGAFVVAGGAAMLLERSLPTDGAFGTAAVIGSYLAVYIAGTWALGLGSAEREVLSRLRNRIRPSAEPPGGRA